MHMEHPEYSANSKGVKEKSHNKSPKWFLSIVSDAISVCIQNERTERTERKKYTPMRDSKYFVFVFGSVTSVEMAAAAAAAPIPI